MSVVFWQKRKKANHDHENKEFNYRINKLIYLLEKLIRKLG